MKKIIAFSKYIYYVVGGAEKSMFEILKSKNSQGIEIELVGIEKIQSYNSEKLKLPQNHTWKKNSINLKFQFNRFFYFEYFLNKKYLFQYFNNLDSNAELYTYGIYAPVAALGFQGSTTIYLRSETDLGINANYYTGLKKILKYFYVLIEYPFFRFYLKDLKESYAKSKLVFNSQWMASECKKRFGYEGNIEYPKVDVDLLKMNFSANNKTFEKGIVFIGDAEIKGLSTVKSIAKNLPNEKFFIFHRHVHEKKVVGNLIYMPWSTDNSLPFKYAKLLIVPSICNEAFGRVSIEAQSLGIPVLVSDRGGLPETVNYNEKFIVKKYLDPQAWVQKISDVGV